MVLKVFQIKQECILSAGPMVHSTVQYSIIFAAILQKEYGPIIMHATSNWIDWILSIIYFGAPPKLQLCSAVHSTVQYNTV